MFALLFPLCSCCVYAVYRKLKLGYNRAQEAARNSQMKKLNQLVKAINFAGSATIIKNAGGRFQ